MIRPAERIALILTVSTLFLVWVAFVLIRVLPTAGTPVTGDMVLPIGPGATATSAVPHGWCRITSSSWVPCGHIDVELVLDPSPNGNSLAQIHTAYSAQRPGGFALFSDEFGRALGIPSDLPPDADLSTLLLGPKGQAWAQIFSLRSIPAGGSAQSVFSFGYTLTEEHQAVLHGVFLKPWPGHPAMAIALTIRWRGSDLTIKKLNAGKALMQSIVDHAVPPELPKELSSPCVLDPWAVTRTFGSDLPGLMVYVLRAPCPAPGLLATQASLRFEGDAPMPKGTLALVPAHIPGLSLARSLQVQALTQTPFMTPLDGPGIAACTPMLPDGRLRDGSCLLPDGRLGSIHTTWKNGRIQGMVS